jgi:hypothetical protein
MSRSRSCYRIFFGGGGGSAVPGWHFASAQMPSNCPASKGFWYIQVVSNCCGDIQCPLLLLPKPWSYLLMHRGARQCDGPVAAG